MHKNRIPLRHFYLAAILYFARLIVCGGFVGCIIWGFVTGNQMAMYAMIGCGVLAILVIVYLMIVSSGLRCPLCRAEIFARRKCSRNEKVKSLFGSYLLPVCLQIIRFSERVRCNYCGTSFRFSGESRQKDGAFNARSRPTMRVLEK